MASVFWCWPWSIRTKWDVLSSYVKNYQSSKFCKSEFQLDDFQQQNSEKNPSGMPRIQNRIRVLLPILVGNSNFWFRFLWFPTEAEFQFHFWFQIFWLELAFWILLLKSHQIRILIPKFGIPNFLLHRNSVHLILYQKTTGISFPHKITSTHSTCKTSRCDFGGQSNHAAKLTSTQNHTNNILFISCVAKNIIIARAGASYKL